MKKFKYKHPQISILLIFLFANVCLTFIFALFIALIENVTYWQGLVYVLTVSFMPDKLFDFPNVGDGLWDKSHFVQLTWMLCEVVLLSGTIIGFISNLFANVFDKNSKALGKIDFNNHMLFLHWSSIGPDLIYDLSFSDEKYDIIILTPDDRDEVINSIESIFITNKKSHKNINIIVKQGSPFSSKDLQDCSIDKAKSIAILTTHDNEGIDTIEGYTDRDVYSLRLMMTISTMISETANIVVEVDTKKTVSKMNQLIKYTDLLKSKKIAVFSYNEALGHIIGNVLIDPAYLDVYYEVLSFDGNEFYSIPSKTMEDILSNYNNCAPVVMYDDNQNGILDQVYVLCDDKKSLHSKKYLRETPYQTSRKIVFERNIVPKDFTVVVIGQNRKTDAIENEINQYNKNSSSNIRFKSVPLSCDILSVIDELEEDGGRKKILILSDDTCDENSVDANIFISLLNLKAENKKYDNLDVYIEILNPANIQATSNFDVTKVLISNRFISLLMIQLLTHPDGINFYKDLITANNEENLGAYDIDIYKTSEILDCKQNLTFSSKAELINAFYYSSDKKCSLIAIVNENEEIKYLCSNLDEEVEITLKPNTVLVVATRD